VEIKTTRLLPKKGLLDKLFANGHWLDAFRFINQEAEQNTWCQTEVRNVVRIDYQIK